MSNESPRHILSLSGGKDSAALAVYMRDRLPEMEYIFHDTGKELPETLDYLDRLQDILRKPIQKTTSRFTFEHWLAVYGGMIPSSHRRWCTKMLKLKPFEQWVGESPVINYVALRADEERTGYISSKPNITTVYPFRQDGIRYEDVVRILQDSGLGMPKYTEWGRTRSGCFFCFFQQKIEWVRLKEKYPDLYEEAKKYERANKVNGNPFYWSGKEPLEELEKPERVAQIKREWEEERAKRRARSPKLLHILGQDDVEDEDDSGACLICQL